MNVEKAKAKKVCLSEGQDAAGQKSEDLFPTERCQRHCRLSCVRVCVRESMYDELSGV